MRNVNLRLEITKFFSQSHFLNFHPQHSLHDLTNEGTFRKISSNSLLQDLDTEISCTPWVTRYFAVLLSVKTNYGSETVIPLYITGCSEKIYSESAVVAKRRRLIRAIYFLTTAGDIKRYHRVRTVISLVSGFFLMLCAC